MKRYEDDYGTRIQAGIYIFSTRLVGPGHLLLGTGENLEEAVEEALKNGRKDANEILEGIRSMEFVLSIEQDDLLQMAPY